MYARRRQDRTPGNGCPGARGVDCRIRSPNRKRPPSSNVVTAKLWRGTRVVRCNVIAVSGASPYGGRCRDRIEAPVRTVRAGPVHCGGGPTFSVTASYEYKCIISIRSSTPWTRIGDVARVELIDLHNKFEWKRNICMRVIIRICCVQCRNDRPTERSLRRYRFLVYTLRLNAKRARIPKCRADG